VTKKTPGARKTPPTRKRATSSRAAEKKLDALKKASLRLLDARQKLSGIDFFRGLLAGDVPRAPMLRRLGIKLLEVDEGRVVFGVVPSEMHYNGLGVAHGGLAATLLDSALGCAINTMMPAGRTFTTLELKVNYTRPLRHDVGEVRCEATVIHVGRRTATSEARIVDASGRIYAHGTTTCIVVEPGSPAGRI
jgi:uncharacterized protein (TIGR00369 family)